ncbi:unnamed protein product [Peniophora sp. CBMAI 1063]|nr:unnamed protein product [Peniophora sp. CBMAI 1063]
METVCLRFGKPHALAGDVPVKRDLPEPIEPRTGYERALSASGIGVQLEPELDNTIVEPERRGVPMSTASGE